MTPLELVLWITRPADGRRPGTRKKSKKSCKRRAASLDCHSVWSEQSHFFWRV
jgi:hypothetical protein